MAIINKFLLIYIYKKIFFLSKIILQYLIFMQLMNNKNAIFWNENKKNIYTKKKEIIKRLS